MPIGPGRYDSVCTHVREATKALGVIVVVFGGEHGSGFSVQAPIDLTLKLPEILEDMARDIRRSGVLQ